MGMSFGRFARDLGVVCVTFLLFSPAALAGVPGGSTVNVNVQTETVNTTNVNTVVNDVILESLWNIIGNAERRNIWNRNKPPEFWEIELTVSDAEFSTALADVKSQLYDLTNVPGRRNTYTILQDEQIGEELQQVSQSFEEVITNETSETTESVNANGAQFGVDYIGDPSNYLTWIAIGDDDVNVDVNQVTTNTTFLDSITTTEYNHLAVWRVSTLRTISPLLLDMDGDGKIQASGGRWLPHRELDQSRMAFFDFHGDKFPVLMEWAGPQDGILVEPTQNGHIDGTNMFGTATGFKNGFEALRVKDENNDGKITGSELKSLSIWMDKNGDARPQAGEVKSVSEHGISRLNLKHKRYASSFVRDGKTERLFDWWPQTFELSRVRIIPKKR